MFRLVIYTIIYQFYCLTPRIEIFHAINFPLLINYEQPSISISAPKKYLLEKYSLIKWFFNFLFHFTFFMNHYFLQTLIFIMNFILFCGIFMEIFEFSIQLEVCEENQYEPHDKMLQNYEFMRKFG